jgi:hypothetical protein
VCVGKESVIQPMPMRCTRVSGSGVRLQQSADARMVARSRRPLHDARRQQPLFAAGLLNGCFACLMCVLLALQVSRIDAAAPPQFALRVSVSPLSSFLDTLAGSWSLVGFCSTTPFPDEHRHDDDGGDDREHAGDKCAQLAAELARVKLPEGGIGRVAMRVADKETVSRFGLAHVRLPAVALVTPSFAQVADVAAGIDGK